MSEEVYRNIASTRSGYVVAPAGCGKTEAIVRAVKDFSTKKQLILTHTHAGVGALKKRFRSNNVPTDKYQIETISGWALSWTRRYPGLSNYTGSLPLPEDNQWPLIYSSMTNLLRLDFVQWVLKNSYVGLIVDEYQDCTLPMHTLIATLKGLIPCRILGDPLQGIFGFNEGLVEWETVETEFSENFGRLDTPFRWTNVQNDILGTWLINSRQAFQNNGRPNFSNSPIKCETVDPTRKAIRLQELCRSLQGSLCVIGPKHGNMSAGLVTSLINVGLRWVEPNDLPKTKECLVEISKDSSINDKAEAALKFISFSFASLGSKSDFIEKILKGTLTRRPAEPNKLVLFTKHSSGYSHQLFIDILNYLSIEEIKCKRIESVNCLKTTLQENISSAQPILDIFSNEISVRKFNGTYKPKRCIGTTLLLKGLEFDHAIILYSETDNAWANTKDLYVAITRGSKSVYLIS